MQQNAPKEKTGRKTPPNSSGIFQVLTVWFSGETKGAFPAFSQEKSDRFLRSNILKRINTIAKRNPARKNASGTACVQRP
ncbi:hypothetical protein [uncultured Allobaculum sp.]|uniref:hypothetical protein n=1 Tax=uncultured Allobaculum sp. TaxID=1187017 RepID=UPI00258EFA74|nr:hypothetical protein [uncultured Allobaculum sp.]